MTKKTIKKGSIYDAVILRVFQSHYKSPMTAFEFSREEFEKAASAEGVELPKNLGDVIYSYRHRKPLPHEILETAREGKEWIIIGAGFGKYRFLMATLSRVEPRQDLMSTKIPDATPEIISKYAMSDEQALLAKLRYNRLVDIFLGITTYSLQSHLRTTVSDMGQIEIDEVYVGVNKYGCHFIVPVQAKRGRDKLGVVQLLQDLTWCDERFPSMIPRAIAAQFMDGGRIAMFELTLDKYDVRVVEEKHYELVRSDKITDNMIAEYRSRYS